MQSLPYTCKFKYFKFNSVNRNKKKTLPCDTLIPFRLFIKISSNTVPPKNLFPFVWCHLFGIILVYVIILGSYMCFIIPNKNNVYQPASKYRVRIWKNCIALWMELLVFYEENSWLSLIYIYHNLAHVYRYLRKTAFTVIFYKYEKNNKWDKVFEQNTMAIETWPYFFGFVYRSVTITICNLYIGTHSFLVRKIEMFFHSRLQSVWFNEFDLYKNCLL